MGQHKHTAINLPMKRMEKIDFVKITVAYRGIATYSMYRAIKSFIGLSENSMFNESLWIIQNSLMSRIVVDTCKFLHESSNISLDTSKITNDKNVREGIERHYKSPDDYFRTLTAYRDKEICHCDFKYLLDKYEFLPMSELSDNIQGATEDKIYLNKNSEYCVRDPKGVVQQGCLPKELNINAKTFPGILKNETFQNAVLDFTSEIGREHTSVQIKISHPEISYEIFKNVFDEILKKYLEYNNTGEYNDKLFPALCSNAECVQESVKKEVERWFGPPLY